METSVRSLSDCSRIRCTLLTCVYTGPFNYEYCIIVTWCLVCKIKVTRAVKWMGQCNKEKVNFLWHVLKDYKLASCKYYSKVLHNCTIKVHYLSTFIFNNWLILVSYPGKNKTIGAHGLIHTIHCHDELSYYIISGNALKHVYVMSSTRHYFSHEQIFTTVYICTVEVI